MTDLIAILNDHIEAIVAQQKKINDLSDQGADGAALDAAGSLAAMATGLTQFALASIAVSLHAIVEELRAARQWERSRPL